MSNVNTAPAEPPRPRSSAAAAVQGTAFVMFLLVAYVLSPGPGFWLLDKLGWSLFDSRWNWVVLIWLPLEWVARQVSAVRAFYEWYLSLWGL